MHADGKPFLWVADTWWEGFVERISDTDFAELARRRSDQGFTVVQIVAGLYPEMAPFAPEGRSMVGWPWCADFVSLNDSWFDDAERRVLALVDNGIVPCIVGSWAYYLGFMGLPRLLRHWRELIARWGAYPVVWCLAGEPHAIWYDDLSTRAGAAPYAPLSLRDHLQQLFAFSAPAVENQLKQIAELARHVRALEPFGRMITIHAVPGIPPWKVIEDDELIDFWMLQTEHWGADRLERAVEAVQEALSRHPRKPVINGEGAYEGLCGANWQETQRFLFWSHLLSGAAGHTYGGHGLWAFNTPDYPATFGGEPKPPWWEVAALPGGRQVGLGGRILGRLPWCEFAPHPEWVEPCQCPDDLCLPYAAGNNDVRVFYFPSKAVGRKPEYSIQLRELLGNKRWNATLIDPRNGDTDRMITIDPHPDGTIPIDSSLRPSGEDWVLLLTSV
jgi:uncharacterized protein DUF4038